MMGSRTCFGHPTQLERWPVSSAAAFYPFAKAVAKARIHKRAGDRQTVHTQELTQRYSCDEQPRVSDTAAAFCLLLYPEHAL